MTRISNSAYPFVIMSTRKTQPKQHGAVRIKHTRVTFTVDDLAVVKAVAKKRLVSFNAFVSAVAVAAARRLLQAQDDGGAETLAASIVAQLNNEK